MNHSWPWAVLALLGAYHGLNPAMGWLFALALGLQEKRRSAVVGALFPIALGHAAAIAFTFLVLRLVQPYLSMTALKYAVAVILFGLGTYRIFRASHPTGAGMRVGKRDLIMWSFLMASAHGAGLMLIPVLLAQRHDSTMHMAAWSSVASLSVSVISLALIIHTTFLLIVSGALALVCFATYEKVGLRLLQHTWLNFDLLWAIALLVAGAATLLW
jgi:hypothetical protein